MDFLPKREAELVTFSQNFADRLNALTTQVGITVEQAAQYESAVQLFITRYQASQNPDTRSPTALISKTIAKNALVKLTRQYAAIVQGCLTTTDEMRTSMGLTIRKTTRTPHEPIEVAPGVKVTGVNGLKVSMQIDDPTTESKRKKYATATGALVYTFVGSEYPADPALWTFHGIASRFEHTITMPFALAAGTQVWVTAAWVDIKGRSGPVAQPVSCNIGYAGALETQQPVRLAA
jgi:hypothetical protein